MRYTLLIASILLLCISSFGQKLRFTEESNVWKIRRLWPETGGYTHWLCSYAADSVVDGVLYKVLNSSTSYFVREDTLAGKVYARPVLTHAPIRHEDTTEQLLFDYNWGLNDTATYIFQGVVYKNVVVALDSVLINGVQHRVWNFFNSVRSYTVVEGIGCLTYPDFPLNPIIFEVEDDLICYTNNTGSPVLSKAVGVFDNSTSCALSSPEMRAKHQELLPNPVGPVAKIVLREKMRTGMLMIVNASGKMVYSATITNLDEVVIDTKGMADGLYLYCINNTLSGEVVTGTFVKAE